MGFPRAERTRGEGPGDVRGMPRSAPQHRATRSFGPDFCKYEDTDLRISASAYPLIARAKVASRQRGLRLLLPLFAQFRKQSIRYSLRVLFWRPPLWQLILAPQQNGFPPCRHGPALVAAPGGCRREASLPKVRLFQHRVGGHSQQRVARRTGYGCPRGVGTRSRTPTSSKGRNVRIY